MADRRLLPGDIHWYDLPDDEAEEDVPEETRRRILGGRLPRYFEASFGVLFNLLLVGVERRFSTWRTT
ncbi:hypothetical protein [Nonomuraea sp. NPDC049784]|uniref:hypothetical protein n=1 Tax=Nonomuraea sp. NPDC049784 TaxID=3154361 RepID=UPI0033C3F9BC